MTHPERDVIADIDALEAEWAEADQVIDHNLRANRGFDDYHATGTTERARCAARCV